ncbi:hypothetical protein ACH5RR_007341 [Cinchona calisaya]|uniref:Phorbol-ester/DAG-type domain-containing protein n=1 Tax=Cinchona calisaya TaxID=153742 RepID=A0ABD3ARJ1_9GENT
MEELIHFSHEKHPLILTQLGQQDDGDHQKSNCYGCQKPTLAEPTYTCEECNIFLHKQCAELPREITHPLHAEHPIKLLAAKSLYSTYERLFFCNACKQETNSFTYHCDSGCEFYVDISCAFAEGKLEHPSHEQHPMMLLRRLARFNCDACGTDEEQQSYVCYICSFWIHRSCALLPKISHRKEHDHPLSLAYYLPIEYRRYEIPCDICFKEIPVQNWVYYCGPCRYFVHLKCMTTNRFNTKRGHFDLRVIEDEQNLVHLPTNSFGNILKKLHGKEIVEFPKKTIKIARCGHRLVFLDIQNDSNLKNEEITCVLCIEPIFSLCGKCTRCNYFVHLTCAQIPEKLQLEHPFFRVHTELGFVQYIWDMVPCIACGLYCNGSFYMPVKAHSYYFDFKCALLPPIVVHEAHKHRLRQIQVGGDGGNRCSSCGKIVYNPCFACEPCGFYLDFGCALLPPSTNHRWDKHPLLLSYPPFNDRPDEFFCEICEEEIHPRRWHYYCRKCDQAFHPGCIPKLGESRNFIFGATLEFGRHPHPLKLIREGDYRSFCDSCHEFMYGHRVFKCETCRFFICFECVRKIAYSGITAGLAKISE